MRIALIFFAASALALATAPAVRIDAAAPAPDRAATTPPAPVPHLGTIGLPCEFEENLGQTAAEVDFVARCRGYVAFLTDGDAVVRTGAEAIRFRVTGGRAAEPVVTRSRPGRSRHFRGSDAVIDAPHAAEVAYRDVLPGVDVVWRKEARELAFDLHIDAGTDASAVRMTVEGAKSLVPDAAGALAIGLPSGETAHLSAPRAWQETGSARRAVEVAFTQGTRADEFGFAVGRHDPALPLVIDPSLSVSTYIGGSATEYPSSVRTDASGNIYVCGSAYSLDFPTTAGAFQSVKGDTTTYDTDGFITKFDPLGSLIWSTYLGGSGKDGVSDVAIDAAGDVCFSGGSTSPTFPIRNAWQTTPAAGIVGKMAASGASLIWCTYYTYGAQKIGLDASGNVRCFTGLAGWNGWPVHLFAFNSTGTTLVMSVALSQYVGGSNATYHSFAVLPNGEAWIGGNVGATSQSAATAGAFQSTYGGGGDVLLTRVSAAGAVVYRSYLGGSGQDEVIAICIDPAGNLCICGHTTSTDFPLLNAAQNSWGGAVGISSMFVTKLNAAASAATFSTFLGRGNVVKAIAANGAGEVFVTGENAGGTYFPIVDAFQPVEGGKGDSFLTEYGAQGTLLRSSYLGGNHQDIGRAMAVSATGRPIVFGETQSTDFPTTGGISSVRMGVQDLFLTSVSVSGSPPTAPTDLVATYLPGGVVSLSWTDTGGTETGFRVERKPDGYPFASLTTTPPDTTSHEDVDLYPGTTYTYRVRAFSASSVSAWSNEASVTIPAKAPVPQPSRPPGVLRAEALWDGTIALSWFDRSDDEIRFALERAEGGASFDAIAFPLANATSHIDDAVHPGWPCVYRVAAASPQGVSTWSNLAAATVPATIRFEVTSGTLVNSLKPLRDAIKFSARFDSELAALDPVANGLEMLLGFATSPTRVSIESGDPGWKLKSTKARRGKPASVVRATWKSPRGAAPKVAVTIDLARGTMTASVSDLNLPRSIGNSSPIRVLLACGAAGGADVVEWTEGKAGVFKFGAK